MNNEIITIENKKSDFIRFTKKINLLPLEMGKEHLINTFYGIVKLYNQQMEYKPLTLTKQELWELSGNSREYNSVEMMKIIREITKSTTYQDSYSKINGSVFVTEELDNGTFKIYVSEPYRRLLFYKKDIDLMTKAKQNKKMTVEELDHWDRETKDKKPFLVLLRKADILGIQGKYNKRLYAMLYQFKKSKKFIADWDKFKDILQVPTSYKSGDIDKQILNKAKKDLKNVGINITTINKIKKGRSIDKIEIKFLIKDLVNTLEKDFDSKRNKGIQSKEESTYSLKTEIRESKNKEIIEYRNKLIILCGKQNKMELCGKISESTTKEQLDKIVLENDINLEFLKK